MPARVTPKSTTAVLYRNVIWRDVFDGLFAHELVLIIDEEYPGRSDSRREGVDRVESLHDLFST